MCPGINGFTKYAPIADWGRKRLGGAYMAVFAMCASWGLPVAGRTHRKKRAMYAPPPAERRSVSANRSGTKPECVLESIASQSALLSRIGWRTRGGVCHVCARGVGCGDSHTSQKARCMRHPSATQPGGVLLCQPVGNEAGMCPGINGFTKYAPIADWGGAHVAVFAMCASEGRLVDSRTHRKRRDVCATPPTVWEDPVAAGGRLGAGEGADDMTREGSG